MKRSNLSVIFLLFSVLVFFPHLLFSQVNLEIPQAVTAPVIDGVIDAVWDTDTPQLLEHILAGNATTSSDFSAKFRTLWDASALYVLAEVTDDSKINDSGDVWQDDAVEVYIDVNNDKLTSYGATDYQYTFRWNDASIHVSNGLTTGIEFKIVGVATGYVLEVKFPWSTLGLANRTAGALLGFDLHVHDDDDGGDRDNKLAWFTTDDNSWQNPSLFATASLKGQTIPSVVDLQIPSTDTAPVIDGVIDAVWNNDSGKALEHILVGSATSSSDFSAYFKTLWDASYLYVLVDVTDDVKVNDSGNVYQDDAVEVYIDINNDKLSSYGANDYSFSFRWADAAVYSNNGGTSGVVFKISASTNGYILEIKFPWETLGLSDPSSGKYIGFDVHVHDDDDGGDRDNKLAWFTTEDNSWQYPYLFATAKLVGEVLVQYAAEKPDVSVNRGFYSSPFDVTISSVIPDMSIYYTLDGSDPKTSSSVTVATAPVVVHIDPENAVNRGKTPGVVLRARAKKDGYDFSEAITKTYLFINKIGLQTSAPGYKWPTSTVNNQVIDLLMDSKVMNDSRYKNLMDESLTEIPTFSISTDYDNLFDASTGIYVNALSHGEDWERPASVELIYPGGTDGFQIDAGLRIRGGYSRNGWFRKHAFRLFFRDEYGEGKLNYSLFGDEGVSSFDKVDLRCSQNYSWSKGDGYESPYCTFNRDVFSRDLQRAMGQPYSRSRYYHLYLNGLYWGLYQTQERSEARFAASYLGGKPEDYDVIKKADSGGIEATDGTLDSWQLVWNLCLQGFTSNANYYKIQGLNANGERDLSLKVLVDIDNLIDYMNIIFYTGNFDAPVSIWGNNKNPNNFYAIYNRNSDQGYKFCAHDNEHTLQVDYINSQGLYENRVNIGSINTDMKMVVTDFAQFQPQWLHYKLSQNAEYRMRFADRAYRYYYNNGILTPEKTAALFRSRALEIDSAVIAESARWGDVAGTPYTKDDNWLPMINRTLNEYFPARSNIVITQLKNEGLLPTVAAPLFKNNNVEITESQIQLSVGSIFTITNPNSSGSIKYTIDGTDPRLTGGGVSALAVDGANAANISILQTCIVKARIFSNGNWSPLHVLNVYVDTKITGIQITEIHYNPLSKNGLSGSEYEFIELKNNAVTPVNLTASTFIDGIKYTFNDETIVEPGGFVVLASSAYAFKQCYGFSPNGEYDGQLDNGGERITLVSPVGDTIVTIKYNDKDPWPTSPDSLGFSLVPAVGDLNADWDDGANWRASSAIDGSPGTDDPHVEISFVLVNEVLSNSESPAVDAIELYNPKTVAVNIGNWYLSDNRDKPTKWKIPAGTTIQANGYLTFYEGHYVNATMAYDADEFGSAFSLSANGDDAYIFSANAAGELTGYEQGHDFGAIESGVTFGRYINSLGKDHFVAQSTPTLNAQNDYPRVGPVVISQIMYNPLDEQFEYLELVNTSSEDVKLYEETDGTPWKVEGIGFTFPLNVILQPGESVFLVEPSISPADFRFFNNLESDIKVYNYPGALKNGGEEITLFKSAKQYVEDNEVKIPYIRIDKVDYNDNSDWPDADGNGYALQRISLDAYGNDPASWVAAPSGVRIRTTMLADAVEKVFYSEELIASGGTPPYTWSITSGALPAGLSFDPLTGKIVGTPTQKGTFMFNVKVEDQSGGSNETSLTIQVKENTVPLANDDVAYITANYAVVLDVLENDVDNDGDKDYWIVSVVSAPSHGTASVNSDKTITYTPARTYQGPDELTYRVTDAVGSSNAKVSIVVEEDVVVDTLEMRIAVNTDDSEENITSHQLFSSSTDLELTYDSGSGGDQIVGVRFQNIDVPQGTDVTDAYIQFTTDETSSTEMNLTIHGELASNPVTFTTDNLISSRLKTTSSVAWQPESWDIVGEASEKQRTPDLSSIMNEIISMNDWTKGNAMVFVITGSGTRVADAYEDDPSAAALLHIEYRLGSATVVVPVANAGSDQDIVRGTIVHLDGSLSTSSDGRRLNYYWSIVSKPSGSSALLSNFNIVNPTFVADTYGTYILSLKVDNGIYESETSLVTFTVENHQPVADAGDDQNHITGATIRLNGSGSSDLDGDQLTYLWNWVSKPVQSKTELINSSSVSPSFIADVEGEYSLNLIVSDELINSVADNIVIHIANNQLPIAVAGDDQNVITGSIVYLDGSKSSDPEDASLTYNWSLVSKPDGSASVLSKASAARPTIQPDKAGTYTINLTVSDGVNVSLPDEIIVTSVDNLAPVAYAGEDITINAGEQVILNGSGSYDPEGSTLLYQWSIVSKPANSNASLSDANTVNPTITPDVSGLYAFKLRVSDGVFTNEDQVQVNALHTDAVISFDIAQSLKVYPNPFADKLVVEYYSEGMQNVVFELCNLSGAVIKSYNLKSAGYSKNILDIDRVLLRPGFYLLVMRPETGTPRTIKLTH